QRSNMQKPRLEQYNEIIADACGAAFVKGSLVPEGPDIEFQAFQFHALSVRDIVEKKRCEVRLSGLRAQAGELRDLHPDQIVATRARIGKTLKRLARLGRPSGSGCEGGDGIIGASLYR